MATVSVVVCTYNRCESLRDTLRSLGPQQLPEGWSLEVIVVDNNSPDRTAEVVAETALGFRWPLRYVLEPVQGIGPARNRGLLTAEGEYILFIDDDAVAHETWTAAIVRCLQETEADLVGGRITPLWLTPRPRWLSNDLLGPVISLDFGPARRQCSSLRSYFLTTNIGFRRQSLSRFGLFDATLGRRGQRWIGGEDLELCERWLRHGARLVYEPDAVVQHKVEPSRITPVFYRQWFRDIGYTQAHQLPWKWHYRWSVLPAWRWAGLGTALLRYAAASLRGSDGERLRAELWWLFQRSYLRERIDHWIAMWPRRPQGPCHFASA